MLGLTELHRRPRPAFRQRPGGAQSVRAGDPPDGEPHRRHPRAVGRPIDAAGGGRHRDSAACRRDSDLRPPTTDAWRFRVACPNCWPHEQGPRLIPRQESPLPEVQAGFRGGVGRAGDERFAVRLALEFAVAQPPYSKRTEFVTLGELTCAGTLVGSIVAGGYRRHRIGHGCNDNSTSELTNRAAKNRLAQFHPADHRRRSRRRQERRARAYAVSAGAERLSAHRPCQEHLPELRPRAGVRRQVQSAVRRHESDQGRAGVRRFDHRRRPLARRRLGRPAVLRVRLFPAALRLGGPAHQGRQGVRLRSDGRRGPRASRHAERAGQEQPVSRSHASRRISTCSRGWRRASFPTAPARCARRSTWRRPTSTCATR